MNKEDIIRMALEAGYDEHHAKFDLRNERFAQLVAEAEREACAKICEDFADQDSGPDGIFIDYHADLIRARGQQ